MGKKSHGAAPGSYTTKGVNCTMEPPFNKAGMGSQSNESAPFNAPRAGGDNGLPTHIYDSLGGPQKTGEGVAKPISSVGTIMADRKK